MRAIRGEFNVKSPKVLMVNLRDRCPHHVVCSNDGPVSMFSSGASLLVPVTLRSNRYYSRWTKGQASHSSSRTWTSSMCSFVRTKNNA